MLGAGAIGSVEREDRDQIGGALADFLGGDETVHHIFHGDTPGVRRSVFASGDGSTNTVDPDMADRVRFELTAGEPTAVFKTAALNHSAIYPLGESTTKGTVVAG